MSKYMSPYLQAKIQTYNQEVNKTQNTKDEIKKPENPKKINKALISIGAAAACSALVIGGILYFKGKGDSKIPKQIYTGFKNMQTSILEKFSAAKTRIQEILADAKVVHDGADTIKTKIDTAFNDADIQKNHDEVMNLIAEGRKNGFEAVKDNAGKVIRSFEVKPKTEKSAEVVTMSEFLDDVLTRRSKIINDSTLNIETFSGNAGKSYRYRDGICNRIDFLDYSGKIPKITERFESCSQWKTYSKNIIEEQNKKFTEEEYRFYEGKLSIYGKNVTSKYDEDKKYWYDISKEKSYSYFSDGTLRKAIYNADIEKGTMAEYYDCFFDGNYYKNIKTKEMNIYDISFDEGLEFDEKYSFSMKDDLLIPSEYINGYKVNDDILTINEYHEFNVNGDALRSGFKNKKYKVVERDRYGVAAKLEEVSTGSAYETSLQPIQINDQLDFKTLKRIQGKMFMEGNNKNYVFDDTGKCVDIIDAAKDNIYENFFDKSLKMSDRIAKA